MKISARLVVAAIFCSVTLSAASAQTMDKKLRNINNLALVFQELDGVSGQCGVTKSLLTRPVDREVAGMPIRFNGSIYNFEVKVVTVRSEAICFSSVDLTLYRFEAVQLRGDPKPVHAKVVLWEEGTIVAATSSTHGRLIEQTMGELVKEFVSDWKKDNT